MTNNEKITTLRNVISDLRVYLEEIELHASLNNQKIVDEMWQDAQSSCEHIIENEPHG